MSMELTEDDIFLVTGVENAFNFEREWKSFEDKEKFMYEHDYIPVRSTKVNLVESEVSFEIHPDIDGVTIEWISLCETTHVFHHLFLSFKRIKSLYTFLKKHVDLRHHSRESRLVFKSCFGIPFFTDSGWEYILGLLPKANVSVEYQSDIIKTITQRWISDVKVEFRNRLIALISDGSMRRTIDKMNIYDVSEIFILPEDSEEMMKVFQESINSTTPPQDFEAIIFSYRFGEKNRGTVSLPIRNATGVRKICLHVGVSVEPRQREESIFWSRNGLQKLVGNIGTLTTAGGLFECANYQSLNYGLSLDVSGKLRHVCRFPETLHFMQLYADIPHRYPKTRYHPVSASIIFGSGLRNSSEALMKEAHNYISEVRSNFMKMTRSVCRLEFVMSLPSIVDNVIGKDLVNVSHVYEILRDVDAIIPFADEHFMSSLKHIGVTVCDNLQSLFDKHKGSSNSSAVWEAYQLELTVEKILWGHPLSYLSNQCAVNLGPGISTPSRCSSDQYGFLRLENKFACCSDEQSSPPLIIYSKSEIVRNQVKKMFGFSDYLKGSSMVLGRKLVEIILEDIYDIGNLSGGFGPFLASMKDGDHGFRVVSVTSRKTLAQFLTSIKKFKFPMVTTSLFGLLSKNQKDIEDLVQKGVEELNVCHFPALRTRDQHDNNLGFWHPTFGVWAVRDLSECSGATIEQRSNLICAMVLNELERRKLCYTRSLNGTNSGFPWIRVCLRKVDELNLSEESLVTIMTFVTCVAFLESGRFVDYNKLRKLEEELPLPQRRLRDLEVQGKFLVNNMNKFMVWRLHHSIPRQSSTKESDNLCRNRLDTDNERKKRIEEAEEQVPLINENEEEVTATQSKAPKISYTSVPRHMPLTLTGPWTSDELAIVEDLRNMHTPDVTFMSLYRKYQEQCRSLGIPDRSFHSFRFKCKRLS